MTKGIKAIGMLVGVVAVGGLVLHFLLLILDRMFYGNTPNPGFTWNMYFVCCGLFGLCFWYWVYHQLQEQR